MRLRYAACLLFFIWFANPGFAQKIPPPPFEIGKVPAEDLQMKVFEPDTAAVALVLYNYGHAEVVNAGGAFHLHWEQKRRVKILKKPGFKYGNISIPFNSYNKNETFYFESAQVHLPNGTTVKVGKKDVFIDKLNDYWSVARFTFPQMEEGCIIEYSYYINSENFVTLRDWYFQEDIPVRWSEFRAVYPSFFEYVYMFQGNEGMEEVSKTDDETLYQGRNGTCRISQGRFVMQDTPGLRPEAYITTMEDYMARIQFQLSAIRPYGGLVQAFLSSWEEFQASVDVSPYLGDQYLLKANHRKLIDKFKPLVAGLGTAAEKADFFYAYLAKNMKWNGRYSESTDGGKLDDIFEAGEGNSAELNLMLYVLLRDADIEAYPLLTSTRDHGRMFDKYPIMSQFNHLMVRAVIDGKEIIMDVGDPLRPAGYPSADALNQQALMLNPKGTPTWITIQPPKDGSDIFIYELTISEEGTLSGTVIGAYKGYNAAPERRHYKEDASGKHWKERLTEKYPDIQIDSVRYGKLDELNETFTDTVYFSLPNAAQVSGDFLYLPPILYSVFDENIFKIPERNYPVDVPYPLQERHILRITLPPGITVEDLPESKAVNLPDNGGSFRFAIDQKTPGKIQGTARLHISQLRYFPDEYPALKDLFDVVVDKYGEQIVLKLTK